MIIIHGSAKGSSIMPDSPESAGFFEATKYTHANTAAARNRNTLAAATPPQENLIVILVTVVQNELCRMSCAE
jgi:hypothetical protein